MKVCCGGVSGGSRSKLSGDLYQKHPYNLLSSTRLGDPGKSDPRPEFTVPLPSPILMVVGEIMMVIAGSHHHRDASDSCGCGRGSAGTRACGPGPTRALIRAGALHLCLMLCDGACVAPAATQGAQGETERRGFQDGGVLNLIRSSR